VTLNSERKEITVPVATLSEYVGAFEMAPTMTIALDGERLTAQLTGKGNRG
jgi:hypothetical protein